MRKFVHRIVSALKCTMGCQQHPDIMATGTRKTGTHKTRKTKPKTKSKTKPKNVPVMPIRGTECWKVDRCLFPAASSQDCPFRKTCRQVLLLPSAPLGYRNAGSDADT